VSARAKDQAIVALEELREGLRDAAAAEDALGAAPLRAAGSSGVLGGGRA
jgi:hypothetical protein